MANTVVIIDGGGRGSALVDKYAQSPQVSKILAIPGNDLMGLNTQKEVFTFPDLKTTSKEEILKLCKEHKADLVDVAQDNAIESGVADLLIENGFNVFGATRGAGQIEWDKAWSRDFMKKYDLPHPKYTVCTSELEGISFIESQSEQSWVIKASGLAEGKGVIIAPGKEEAIKAISEMKKFNEAGKTYLIEQFLKGEEFSTFAIADGNKFKIIGSAQDHKRVFDGDHGPNTGGMGCSTPPLVLTEDLKFQTMQIVSKTITGLKKEGRPFKGILYLGGIVVDGKILIIEFNARWGDPEVECILPGVQTDLFELSMKAVQGKLEQIEVEMDDKSRVVVAGASKGYPTDYSEVKGKQIFGIDEALRIPGIKFYSAGIKKEGEKYLVSGGRLFYVVGEGKDVIEAREKAYEGMKKISIEGDNLHFRTDIGFRDVERISG